MMIDTASSQSKELIVEEGGTGRYKSIMKEEASLPAHTVFVPQDLSAFNATNPLPVLVWGNGACTDSPWEHFKFLNLMDSSYWLRAIFPWWKNPTKALCQPLNSK